MAAQADAIPIVGGDRDGFARAADMVCDNPNPWHIEEDFAALGYLRTPREIIGEVLANTVVASYAVKENAAIVCGFADAPAIFADADNAPPYVVWMLATANSVERPRWMIREMRKRLALGREFLGGKASLVQLIPMSYREGVDFARHMGFPAVRYVSLPATGRVFAVVRGD